MPDSIDYESKLRDLTQRQCEILYWVCQGLTLKETAQKIGFGEDLVTAEMSRMYDLFGLKKERKNAKRRKLEQTICPLHLQRVSNPELDCRERVIEVNAPPPDPETIGEVREDVQMGLIPLYGAMIRVPPPPPDTEPARGKGGNLPPRPYPRLGPPTPKAGSRLKDILILVLGALLLVTICALVAVLVGAPQRLFPTATPEVAKGITPVSERKPPQTTPSAGETAVTPAITPSPAVPTVQTVTPEPPTPIPPSPTHPLQANKPDCASGGRTLNLAGKVESDLPGTPLCSGDSVTSIVDKDTKPLDVYAFDLKAGQEVRISISNSTCCYLYPTLFNPDTPSLDRGSVARGGGNTDNWNEYFTPAVSGTHYLSIRASNSGQKYGLTIKPTGKGVIGGQSASDIPGTPITVGTSTSSVVDNQTKPRDVYAIELEAGHDVRFKISHSTCCYLRVTLLNPGSTSVEGGKVSVAFGDQADHTWDRTFSPAVSGTYYIVVEASVPSQPYTLSTIRVN